MTLLLSDLFLDYKSHWIIIGRQGHTDATRTHAFRVYLSEALVYI